MKKLTLAQMHKMPIGKLAQLPPQEIYRLIDQADKQLQQAKLAKQWLQAALKRQVKEKKHLRPVGGKK